MTRKILPIVLLISLISCAEQGGPLRKSDVGALLGAVGGTIIGSKIGKGSGQYAAIAIGALAGSAIGNSIGNSMDEVDRRAHGQSVMQSLEYAPIGRSIEWNNPDSGHKGYVVPERTYREHNRYCREYTQVIFIGNKKSEGVGKACRNPDGTWEIMNNN